MLISPRRLAQSVTTVLLISSQGDAQGVGVGLRKVLVRG